MRIWRDGNSYELTNDELKKAYLEYQHIRDKDEIESELYGLTNGDVSKFYGITREEFLELSDAMATRMRRYITESHRPQIIKGHHNKKRPRAIRDEIVEYKKSHNKKS